MSRRAWAATALLGLGLLLLATTQPWVRTVTEVAPGAPRTRGVVEGTDLVPWLAPTALVAALALLLALARVRAAGPVAVVASLVVVAGAVTGALGAAGAGPADGVVTAGRTGWLWVGYLAALLAAAASLLWWLRPGPAPARAAGTGAGEDPDGAEARRRGDAQAWRDLSEGRDPTEG